MKNICSMKTIAVLFLVLFAFMGAHKAFAGPLTEREEVMLNAYMTDASARPAVRIEYWMSVARQSERIQRTLPAQLGPNMFMVGIEYDGLTTVTYSYYTDDQHMNVEMIKGRLLNFICPDPQVVLLLSVMDGSMIYDYYLYPNNDKVWQTFSISQTDCSGPGI